MFHRRYGSSGFDYVADEKTGKEGFAIIDDGDFYIVNSHGNSLEWWMTVSSSVVIFAEKSRSLMVVKSLQCFDAMFTVLYNLVEPNLTLTGVMYRLFSLLYFCSVCYIAVIIMLIGCIIANI